MHLAQAMYEGYCRHTNWKSLATGADLPQWEGLRPDIKAAWEASAKHIARDQSLNYLALRCHADSAAAGWWDDCDIDTNPWVIPGKIALMHSELSEGLEGYRKGLMDDKLPHRRMFEVELADALIRILDMAGKLGYDIDGAVAEKLAFNRIRPDHTREARAAEGGKKV